MCAVSFRKAVWSQKFTVHILYTYYVHIKHWQIILTQNQGLKDEFQREY